MGLRRKFLVVCLGLLALPSLEAAQVVGLQVTSDPPAANRGNVLELTASFLQGEKSFSVRVSAFALAKDAAGATTPLLSRKTNTAWVNTYGAFSAPNQKELAPQASVNRIALPVEDILLEVPTAVVYQVESLDASGTVLGTVYSTPGTLQVAAGTSVWQSIDNRPTPAPAAQEPTGGGFGKPDVVETQPPLQPARDYPARTEAENATVQWRYLNNPLNSLEDTSHTLVYFVSNRPWRGVTDRTKPWEGLGSTYQPFDKLETLTRGAVVVRTPSARERGDIQSVQAEGLVGPYQGSPYSTEQNQAASQFLEWIWGQDALIFIHGYNNTFKAAAEQAAQLKADLKFPGPVVLFSWPSLAEGGGYFTDKLNAEKSIPLFADLITHFAQGNEEDPKRFYCRPGKSFIIAHSMGNWVLLNALGLANARQKLRVGSLGKIVLAAPDVSRVSFEQWAPVAISAARNVTVYYSKKDTALDLSSIIHWGKRAGQGAGVQTTNGIDAIDVDAVNSRFIRFGHSAFSASDKVLTDIALNFLYDIPVWKRSPPLIRNPTSVDSFSHWHF